MDKDKVSEVIRAIRQEGFMVRGPYKRCVQMLVEYGMNADEIVKYMVDALDADEPAAYKDIKLDALLRDIRLWREATK